MMEFRNVSRAEGKEFKEAMELYLAAFPASERHPVEVIAERVNRGLSRLYVGAAAGEVVFLALLWPLKNTDFILLDYIATKDTYRGKGIASAFLEEMRAKLEGTKKYLVLEVESPGAEGGRAEREKRISFYRRHGARQLKGVRYALPPLHGDTPTEMIFMLFPGHPDGRMDGTTVKKLIVQIYQELYGRGADDPLLLSFIGDVGGEVELV